MEANAGMGEVRAVGDARVALLLEQMEERVDREGWFAPMRKALLGVTAAQAAWVPAPGCNSIWQIVNHLTFWSAWVLRRLEGERPTGREIDNDATFGGTGDPADEEGWARAVAALFDVYARLAEALAASGEGTLERPLNSRGTPARTILAGDVMHDAYHAGQIVLIRRLQGAWPPAG